jgi:hypothetical protein
MVSSKSELIQTEQVERRRIVVLEDGWSLKATHQGKAIIPPNVQLTEVLFVLGLKENLFLVGMASAIKRGRIMMDNGSSQVMKDGKVALSAKKWGGIFQVMVASVTQPKEEDNAFVNYHRQCGHMNFKTIRLMSKTSILPPMKEQWDQTDNVYQMDIKGKMTITGILKLSTTKTRKPSKLV